MDLDLYDHTYIESIPAILINGYFKQRNPYLTDIHLWDKRSDYLIYSKHDLLNICLGEGGIPSHSIVSSCSASTSPTKRSRKCNMEQASTGIVAVMKSVIGLCNDNNNSKEKVNKVGDGNIDKEVVMIEDLGLKYLYVMIEQRKLHMNFLKEHDILTAESKNSIYSKISNIFEIIEGRTLKKGRVYQMMMMFVG